MTAVTTYNLTAPASVIVPNGPHPSPDCEAAQAFPYVDGTILVVSMISAEPLPDTEQSQGDARARTFAELLYNLKLAAKERGVDIADPTWAYVGSVETREDGQLRYTVQTRLPQPELAGAVG